jgi:tetratricopeptide (TPR) repeat protein/transcriptional regulator with XRE-family HTH domain
MGRRPGKTPRPERPPLARAIRRLRQTLECPEAAFGAPSGISVYVVSNLEAGVRKRLSREEAEGLIHAGLGLPPVALDVADGFDRWVRAAAPPPEPLSLDEEDLRRCEVVAGIVGLHVGRELVPLLARRLRAERDAQDRREAEEQCGLLRELPTWPARQERIRSTEACHTWACVERLAAESEHAAADNADDAIAWARLALCAAAHLAPESRRKRMEGWAGYHLGNALRVKSYFRTADIAFERAEAEFLKGNAEDLPLDQGTPFDLLASLRREQRRFPEAMDLHKRALTLSPEKGRVLLNMAFTLEQSGDAGAALEVLEEARPYVEASGDLRDKKVLLGNLSVCLRKLGKLMDAEALVPALREVVLQLGNDLDLTRTLWNEGLIDAGLGRIAKAAATLEQVLDELIGHGLPWDAALAGLDLAVVHLEAGRTREVMGLAVRLEGVFRAYQIEREALAALLVFCEAARREEATVELIRQTAEILEERRRALLIEGRGGREPRGQDLPATAPVGVKAAPIVQGLGGGRGAAATAPVGVHDAPVVGGLGVGRGTAATAPVGVHAAPALQAIGPEGKHLVPELDEEGCGGLGALAGDGASWGGEQGDEHQQGRNADEGSGHEALLGQLRRGLHGSGGLLSSAVENSTKKGSVVIGRDMDGLLAAVLVRRLYLRNGESWAPVARLVGVSRRSLWSYMTGRRTPEPATLVRLGEAAGIPAAQLDRLRRLLDVQRLAELGGFAAAGSAWGPSIAAEVAAKVLETLEETGALLLLEPAPPVSWRP